MSPQPDLARLRRLTRQAGTRRGAAESNPAPIAPHPSAAIQDVAQLRRLLRLHAPQARAPAAPAADRHLPGSEIAPGLRLVTETLPVPPLPATLDGRFDRKPPFDPLRVLFFDTETTGLTGGTGTRAFMIGAARWLDAGTLQVRQLTLTSLAAEAAMLRAFAGWLTPATILASYNGKSYDAPLLRTRLRLARLPDALADLPHVDLLYPTRRRYRGQFENCRLRTIEREVLRIVRDNDLPGSEAPAAWLTFLRGGSARLLRRVTRHNRDDVVHLARLLRHLSAATEAECRATDDLPQLPPRSIASVPA